MRLLGPTLLFVMTANIVQADSSIVPKLDVEGRRGDMARLANQRALEKFNAADANGDGKLSKEEVENAFPFLSEKFAEHDKNGDGFLSWEEYIGHDRWAR
jgi:Ca2+-binding EF-hand superfamily protein